MEADHIFLGFQCTESLFFGNILIKEKWSWDYEVSDDLSVHL